MTSPILDVDLMIDELGNRVAAERSQDFIKHAADVVSFITHHRDPEDHKLPVVQRLYLRYRHVEAMAQAIFDAAYHLPLVFETTRLPQQEPHAQGTDYHSDLRDRTPRSAGVRHYKVRCTC